MNPGDPICSAELMFIVKNARTPLQAVRLLELVKSCTTKGHVANFENGSCRDGKTCPEDGSEVNSPEWLTKQCRHGCLKDTVVVYNTVGRLWCIKSQNADGTPGEDCAKLNDLEMDATVEEELTAIIILANRGIRSTLTSVGGEDSDTYTLRLFDRVVGVGYEAAIIGYHVNSLHGSMMATADHQYRTWEDAKKLCDCVFREMGRLDHHYKSTKMQDPSKPGFIESSIADPDLLPCVHGGVPTDDEIEAMCNDNRWK